MYSDQTKGLAGIANAMSPQIGQAEDFYAKKVAEEGADPNDMTAFISKLYKVTQDPNLIGAIVNRHMAKQIAATMPPPGGAQPAPPTVTDKIKLDLMNLKKAKQQKAQQAQSDLQQALSQQDTGMNQGIGSMDAGTMEAPQHMNGGGIVAFAEGGGTPEQLDMFPDDLEEKISQAEEAAAKGDTAAKSWLSKTRQLINKGQYGTPLSSGVDISPKLKSWAASGSNLARKIATPVAIAGAAGDVYGEVTDPNATVGEKALRVARTAGRLSAQGLGSEVGAGLGALTGPAAPIVSPLLGIAGGYGAGKLYDLLGSEDDNKPAPTAPSVAQVQADRAKEQADKLEDEAKVSNKSSSSGTDLDIGYTPLSTKGLEEGYEMTKAENERRQKEINERAPRPKSFGASQYDFDYVDKMRNRAGDVRKQTAETNAYEHAMDLISAGGRGQNLALASGEAGKNLIKNIREANKDYNDAMQLADDKYVAFKDAEARAKATDDQNDWTDAEAKKVAWHEAAANTATAKDNLEKAKVDVADKNVGNKVAIANAKSSRIAANASAAYKSSSSGGASATNMYKFYTALSSRLKALESDPSYYSAKPEAQLKMARAVENQVRTDFGIGDTSDGGSGAVIQYDSSGKRIG